RAGLLTMGVEALLGVVAPVVEGALVIIRHPARGKFPAVVELQGREARRGAGTTPEIGAGPLFFFESLISRVMIGAITVDTQTDMLESLAARSQLTGRARATTREPGPAARPATELCR